MLWAAIRLPKNAMIFMTLRVIGLKLLLDE